MVPVRVKKETISFLICDFLTDFVAMIYCVTKEHNYRCYCSKPNANRDNYKHPKEVNSMPFPFLQTRTTFLTNRSCNGDDKNETISQFVGGSILFPKILINYSIRFDLKYYHVSWAVQNKCRAFPHNVQSDSGLI